MTRPNPYLLFMVLSVVVSAVSQVLLKMSARRTYASALKEYLNPLVLGGYTLMVVSTLLMLAAFHFGVEFKNGPVIEALGYVLVLILGRAVFGEKLTRNRILGNALILAGIAAFYLL